jgi:IPT/TIG domain
LLPLTGSLSRITVLVLVCGDRWPRIDDPEGITAGPDGALWFTNSGNDSIGRITTAVTPEISGFTPASGAAGTTVTITGQNLAGATAVAFGGTPAAIVSATATQIVTTVPAGAATGPITVTTPAGTATSHGSFTVT